MSERINYYSDSIVETDKKVLAIIVNSYGTAIPKVVRQEKSILNGYKDMLKKQQNRCSLVGRCLPLFSMESANDRFYALLVINGMDGIENATRSLINFCHAIGESSVAIRDCDYNIVKDNLTNLNEVDVMEHG